MGRAVIAGLDEVGRGALAGPVVAAACIFERRGARIPRGVRIMDSKMLRADERERAFAFLMRTAPFGIGIVDASVVDTMGILGATEIAMQRALANLQRLSKPSYLLIDGRDKFWFDLPHSSIIGGDRLEPCIAASSIVAKVTRDCLMMRCDGVFPGYSFAQHKGYGTQEHQERIRSLGPCILHRRTFLGRMSSKHGA